MEYINPSIYTAQNTIVPFTLHGLTSYLSFTLHGNNKTSPYHFSVYTAWNTEIPPFTPHRIQKLLRLHRMEYRNSSVYIAWNTKTPPFTPHGIQKLLCLHCTEYKCAIYTAWLNKSYFPFTLHGNNKPSPYHLSVYTAQNTETPLFTPHGIQKLLRVHHMEYSCAIYTAWLNISYLPFTTHGNNKTYHCMDYLNLHPFTHCMS